MQHSIDITGVRFAGAEQARLSTMAVEAVTSADALRHRPVESDRLDRALLAVPTLQELVEARRDRNVAVSPIIGGAALKDPPTACCESWARKARWWGWPAAIAILPPHS